MSKARMVREYIAFNKDLILSTAERLGEKHNGMVQTRDIINRCKFLDNVQYRNHAVYINMCITDVLKNAGYIKRIDYDFNKNTAINVWKKG